MNRIFFTLAISLFASLSFGQSIYIKPIWGSRVNYVKKNPANKPQISHSFLYEDYNLYSGFLPNDIGLLLGYKFKKIPIAIEAGTFKTETGSGYNVYFRGKSGNSYFGSSGGWELPTITTLFRFWPTGRLYDFTKKRRLEISFTIGIGYIRPAKDPVDNIFNDFSQLNDSETIFINMYSGVEPRSSKILDNIMFSGGVSSTFLTKKSREILTISLQLYYVRHEQSHEMAEVWINNSIPIRYYSNSTGSGFGLSLTRNFNIYKWKEKK